MKKILLTQGKSAIVDDCDFEWLNRWPWRAGKSGNVWYAKRTVRKNHKQTTIQMHRLVLNTPSGMQTDHINHDGLDNRRCNLRVCTQNQNLHNRRKSLRPTSSKYKGVCWFKQDCKWLAQIMHNGKKTYLGLYDSETEAAQAYNRAALKHFGEFANINIL